MFAHRVYETIQNQGRTQAWVARQMGLTPTTFRQKMSGYRGRRFYDDEQEEMAKILGIPRAKLFPTGALAEAETA